jgi:ABC-type sugar transport system ATPase subunit
VPGTIVYVTHDQVEAMTMGDRIAVMSGGRLAQLGSAMEIYDQPATRFVAGFIGAPPMSLLDGHLAGDGSGLRFRSDGVDVALPGELAGAAVRGDHGRDGWTLGIRPEAIELRSLNGGPPWRVEVVEQLGADCVVGLRCGGSFVRSRLGAGARPAVDAEVELSLPDGALRLFTPSGHNVLA